MKAHGSHCKARREAGFSGQKGFTLLELLVVVTIMSIMTTVASLGVTLGRQSTDSDAVRFLALFNTARQEAVAEGRVVGLLLAYDQAQRMRRDAGEWVPDGEAVTWLGTARIDGIEGAERMIVLWPSDQSAPLRVEFSPGTDGPVRCRVTGVGAASCSG